ncbi:HAMP domain-containing protein [Rhodovastum atsumiense]|uniref:HAMP domain-containing protein n=1 Tax=Rhodovastum atsumiense TaxID=504468 RepID=A0A5M6IWK5_9PROT|nr:methyl-accepting chemotaxis protein [Rhodovastum atsumiense]KAA5612700.1 HAMP domain-containing protein [Rhodovastum atsumiense]CAH2602749.1 HAMP domain-containing protein [Rhodovastum atsumiense]
MLPPHRWLAGMKVQAKLLLLCLLFLVPIGFLTFLFVAQTRKDIVFATKEQVGVSYVAALRAQLNVLVDIADGRATADAMAPAQRAVRAAMAEHAATMAAEAAADKAALAIDAALALPRDRAAAAALDTALDAVKDHLTQVADGSNLTLDPDLDSFYMQDLVTQKLPALVLAASRALDAALDLRQSRAPTPAQTVRLLRAGGELSTVLDGLDSDVAAALRGNPDGSVRTALSGLLARFQEPVRAYARLLDAAATADAPPPEAATLREAEWQVQLQARAVWDAMSRELDHLLAARIDGMQQRMTWSLCLTLAVLTISASLAWFIATSISRPLRDLRRTAQDILGGTPDTEVPHVGRADEIGEMADAVRAFREHVLRAQRLAAEQERDQQRAAAEKRQAMAAMADTVEATTASAMAEVTRRVQAMAEAATSMQGSASRTGSAASGVAGAAAETMVNTQAAASAAEQLAASIREIAQQVSQSAMVTRQAVAGSHDTRTIMATLNDRVARIGNAAGMITEIAAKTNLLALNATIEAARAGEAGRGFTVVAGEVKALAGQTARATEEIARQIEEIRSATEQSVAAVGRIERTIGEVDEIAGSIAAAVEQQGTATAEIARKVTDAATAANGISARAAEVSAEAGHTDQSAATMHGDATSLAGLMGALRESVVQAVRSCAA